MSADPYLGDIMLWPMAFEPRNWAFCDGRLLDIRAHRDLFSLLGTTYGGDGVNNFALPDLRSRTPVGPGQAPSLKNVKLAESGGVETVQLEEETTPKHRHKVNCQSELGNSETPVGSFPASENIPFLDVWRKSKANAKMNPNLIEPVGGNESHDNRSPYLGQNFVIALFGELPRRN